MKLFKKIFKQKGKLPSNPLVEQAVIVKFNYGFETLQELHQMENLLRKQVDEKHIGEYDGHEIAVDMSDGILYFYGPNAEIIYNSIIPIFSSIDFMKGAAIQLRIGPPEEGVKEQLLRVPIE